MFAAALSQAIISHIGDPNVLTFEEVMPSTIKFSFVANVGLPPVDSECSLSVAMVARHIGTETPENL